MADKRSHPLWLAPWIAPLVLLGAYVAELIHEGAPDGPVGFDAQLVFAVPLIVAGTVLLTVLEQQIRIGTLTGWTAGWLLWTPRVLILLFALILAVFSLDVVEPGRGPGEIALGLLMHNLPALSLLLGAAAAWRWPLIGAGGLATFALSWFVVFVGRGLPPSVVLLVGVFPLTVAALFVASWLWLSPRPATAGSAGRTSV